MAMAIRGWLLKRAGNALAFVFTVSIGIVAGGLLTVSEAFEEQLTWKKRHATQQHAASALKRPKS